VENSQKRRDKSTGTGYHGGIQRKYIIDSG
jgi:hypothetical protein